MNDLSIKYFNGERRNSSDVEAMRTSQKLRKLVYCDELKFENVNSEQESDEYDKFSHGVLILKESKPVATVRLVSYSELGLPCMVAVNHNGLEMPKVNLEDCVEISRFLILPEQRVYSDRKDESPGGHSDILMALYLSIFCLASLKKRSELVYIAEMSLIRKIRLFGIKIEIILEKPIFHKTKRWLCKIDVSTIYDSLVERNSLHAEFNSILRKIISSY
jgi:N-acyl amino acid synthase of PEP-CTERM/exosortase system